MDKIIKLSLMLSMLFLFSSQAAADSYFSKSGEKLVSGVTNVATGFVELPKNVILKSQQEGVVYGVTAGLVTGIMHSVGRTVIGALDIVTFIIPTNPSVNPHYVWQDFSRETTY
ncbi:MAG: exosortase system-associated protein, TIGR04073 family [Nitrosomonas sp.]|nr:exosortase system-associated protein, TIGR04073 family [Nitrosomonas sp.]